MIELCLLLSEGIKKERESREFYALHGRDAKQKDLRALFEMLAREEEEHERVLEAMQKRKTCSLDPLGKPASLNAKPPKIAESFARSEDAGEFSTTLLAAMSFEQKSKGFYEALVLATEKAEDKKVFASLAGFEQRHYELLNEMYEQLNYFRLQT